MLLLNNKRKSHPLSITPWRWTRGGQNTLFHHFVDLQKSANPLFITTFRNRTYIFYHFHMDKQEVYFLPLRFI